MNRTLSTASAPAIGQSVGYASDTKPAAPVEAAMDSLHQAERALASRVSLLGERLSMVLAPPSPSIPGNSPKGAVPIHIGSCSLCSAIRDREEGIRNTMDAIDDLMSRLEV